MFVHTGRNGCYACPLGRAPLATAKEVYAWAGNSEPLAINAAYGRHRCLAITLGLGLCKRILVDASDISHGHSDFPAFCFVQFVLVTARTWSHPRGR